VNEQGFRVIKLSMCDFEPLRYIELVHDIRSALGPDIEIRVDPHASWSESEALRFMKGVEDCRVEWIEEPVGGRFENIFKAGHRLRAMSSVPISSHAWLPPLLHGDSPGTTGRYTDAALNLPLDLDVLSRYQPADISAPDAYDGPLALKRYYDTARFMGMDIAMHSSYELGPGTAIRLHIAAFAFPYKIGYHIVWGNGTAPFALHALDAHYNQWEGDVIQGGKLKYDQGCLVVPEGPGLGVALDHDLLEHYRWTEEKHALHLRHIEAIRARHADALGWRRNRMGWLRTR
jgi:glucarate dehydratase